MCHGQFRHGGGAIEISMSFDYVDSGHIALHPFKRGHAWDRALVREVVPVAGWAAAWAFPNDASPLSDLPSRVSCAEQIAREQPCCVLPESVPAADGSLSRGDASPEGVQRCGS